MISLGGVLGPVGQERVNALQPFRPLYPGRMHHALTSPAVKAEGVLDCPARRTKVSPGRAFPSIGAAKHPVKE